MTKREIKVRNINDKATDYYFIYPFTCGGDRYLKETYGNRLRTKNLWLDNHFIVPKNEIDNFPKEKWMVGCGYELTDKFSTMTIKEFVEGFLQAHSMNKDGLVKIEF